MNNSSQSFRMQGELKAARKSARQDAKDCPCKAKQRNRGVEKIDRLIDRAFAGTKMIPKRGR